MTFFTERYGNQMYALLKVLTVVALEHFFFVLQLTNLLYLLFNQIFWGCHVQTYSNDRNQPQPYR